MFIKKPILWKLAEETIAELRRDGIECAPDEILWLNEMAGKVIRPAHSDELLFLDLPVPCGNTLLWPLTIGARIWLEQYGKPWFAGTGDLEELVFAFALAHSRRPETLFSLASCLKARIKVALWARTISATRRELNEAIARCIAPDDCDLIEVEGPKPKNLPASSSGYGDCIALLCHFYGETPRHWLWQTSEDECAALLNKISQLLPADKAVGSDHAGFINFSRFRLVVSHIRQSRTKDQVGRGIPEPEGTK